MTHHHDEEKHRDKDKDKNKEKDKDKAKDKEAAGTETENELWCTEDLDFDENGCLYITNQYLARAVFQAIYDTTHRFCITMDDPGAPGNKINAMCPC